MEVLHSAPVFLYSLISQSLNFTVLYRSIEKFLQQLLFNFIQSYTEFRYVCSWNKIGRRSSRLVCSRFFKFSRNDILYKIKLRTLN